jgi:hypothetical protein
VTVLLLVVAALVAPTLLLTLGLCRTSAHADWVALAAMPPAPPRPQLVRLPHQRSPRP